MTRFVQFSEREKPQREKWRFSRSPGFNWASLQEIQPS